MPWLGWSRTGRWDLWQRDEAWGVEVIFDAERSGRPRVFSPLQRVHRERVACTDPAAYSLPLARWACRRLQAGVVEQAIVGSMHATTGAQIVAQASRPPHRRRSWQTATSDARCVTQAAKMLWWYDRGQWRDERAEVVLCGDATPPL